MDLTLASTVYTRPDTGKSLGKASKVNFAILVLTRVVAGSPLGPAAIASSAQRSSDLGSILRAIISSHLTPTVMVARTWWEAHSAPVSVSLRLPLGSATLR